MTSYLYKVFACGKGPGSSNAYTRTLIEAIVGIITAGIFKRNAMALPASISFPPPVAIRQLMSCPSIASTCELISLSEHSPPNMSGIEVMPALSRLEEITVPITLCPRFDAINPTLVVSSKER